MARHEGQNKDELEYIQSNQLFYGDGRSKAGRRVFYYIARRYMYVFILKVYFLFCFFMGNNFGIQNNWSGASLIFTLLTFRNDMISDEVFLYHILLTLQPVQEEGWELVVDFSHTSPVNRFKVRNFYEISDFSFKIRLLDLYFFINIVFF